MQLLIDDSHLFLFMGVHILRACMQCPQRAPETGVKDGPESPGVWVLGTEQPVLCPAEPSPSFVICSFFLSILSAI